mgnify:CR=1 FL=1
MKASLHLQTVQLQRGSTIAISAAQRAAIAAAQASVAEEESASTTNQTVPLTQSPSQSDDFDAASAFREAMSQQMLPDLDRKAFRYVGGKHWFINRRTKQYFNTQTKVKQNTLPPEVVRVKENEKLTTEILRLEIKRRDRERLHVATQVNKAVDMLMDKLDNDEFAAEVFTKEAALQSEHRKTVSDDEKQQFVANAMFHYFDKDHSDEIDAVEFGQGITMLVRDAERTSRESNDLEERSSAARSVEWFEKLTPQDLANVFHALAGDDALLQMDEFMAFYNSEKGAVPLPEKRHHDGESAEGTRTAKGLRKAIRLTWKLLRDSEDVMLTRGRLDELAAEQRLVEQTYAAMRDQATKSFRARYPAYTNDDIPFSIMPKKYLSELADKESKLAAQEEHYSEVLAGLEAEGVAIKATVVERRRSTMAAGDSTTTVVPTFCERLRRCLCLAPYRRMSDDGNNAARSSEAATAAAAAATTTATTTTAEPEDEMQR